MSITPLSEGLWRVEVRRHKQPDGKRPHMVRHVRGGIREAQAVERELYRLRDEQRAKPSTVEQYAAYFLADKRRIGLAHRTLVEYGVALDAMIADYGATELTTVTSKTLRELFAAMEQGPRGKLSGTTRQARERPILTMFRQAAAEGLIPDITRGIVKTPSDGGEPLALSPDEGVAFLASIRGTPVYLPATFMYCTGARPQEMLGLKRECVHPDSIDLFWSVYVKGGTGHLKDKMKTKRSKRSIPIGPELHAALIAHIAGLDALAGRMGDHWQDMGLVFPSCVVSGPECMAGRVWTPTAFGHAWRRHVPQKWRHVTPYTMRHTYITQRLLDGWRLEVVSRLAGHASSAITAQRYSHVIPGELEAVVVEPPRAAPVQE